MKKLSMGGLPAAIVLTITLVVGATSGALAAGLVTSSQIKDNTIKSVDVHDGTLQSVDFSDEAQSSLQGPQGPQGPKGDQGPQGPKGDTGSTGPAGTSHWTHWSVTSGSIAVGGSTGAITASCPAGDWATGGSVDWQAGYDFTGGQLSQTGFTGYGLNSQGAADHLVVWVHCAHFAN